MYWALVDGLMGRVQALERSLSAGFARPAVLVLTDPSGGGSWDVKLSPSSTDGMKLEVGYWGSGGRRREAAALAVQPCSHAPFQQTGAGLACQFRVRYCTRPRQLPTCTCAWPPAPCCAARTLLADSLRCNAAPLPARCNPQPMEFGNAVHSIGAWEENALVYIELQPEQCDEGRLAATIRRVKE